MNGKDRRENMGNETYESENLILDKTKDKEFIEKWGITYDVDPAWDVKDEDILPSERK